MSLFRKKGDKKINLYALYKRESPEKFLTVTVEKEEALEYALALLKLEKSQHFNSWCFFKNCDVHNPASWDEYYNTCISEEEKREFMVCSITYKLKDITAIVRMFGGSKPLGCSFNTPIEYEYAQSKIHLSEIAKELQKEIDESKKAKEEINGQ